MSNNNEERVIPKLCLECRQMFGNPSFQDMCSKCYRKSLEEASKKIELQLTKKEIKASSPKTQILKFEQKMSKKQSKQQNHKIISETGSSKLELSKQIQKQHEIISKCSTCNKKVGLLGYNCSHCNGKYCKIHRLPQEHQCKADFISLGRKKLKLENPHLQVSKIEKI